MMIFKTSMDSITKTITILISALLIVILFAEYLSLYKDFKFAPIITGALFTILYIITFVFKPIHYIITSNKLLIHRLSSDVEIDRNQIKQVEQLDATRLHGSIRIFGVGGLFGYYGRYTNKNIGNMRWYATRKNKTVLLITNTNEKIILTPDEPEQFIAELQAGLSNRKHHE